MFHAPKSLEEPTRTSLASSRRRFLKNSALAVGAISVGAPALRAATRKNNSDSPRMSASDLPKGSSPQPVTALHFPDRLHAFVWRNWPLVPVETMAAVVGAKKVV